GTAIPGAPQRRLAPRVAPDAGSGTRSPGTGNCPRRPLPRCRSRVSGDGRTAAGRARPRGGPPRACAARPAPRIDGRRANDRVLAVAAVGQCRAGDAGPRRSSAASLVVPLRCTPVRVQSLDSLVVAPGMDDSERTSRPGVASGLALAPAHAGSVPPADDDGGRTTLDRRGRRSQAAAVVRGAAAPAPWGPPP